MSKTESTDSTPKHRRKEWLVENYVNADRTVEEAGELAGVSGGTISSWLTKHGLSQRQQQVDLSDVDIPDTKPWKDAELMRTLYVDKKLSSTQISGVLDCSGNTVLKNLRDHGIELRNRSQAMSNSHGNLGHAHYYSKKKSGRPIWKSRKHEVHVYRLLAVAEYGFDAVCDMDVHHINGIVWDNRPDNIELVDRVTHQHLHRRIKGERRRRVADEYEHRDVSLYTLADELEFDISPATIRNIHSEFYGDSSE